MSKIGAWSTSAGSNTATPPDGWPENMAPSGVNDAAREMMAQIKTFCNDAEWFDRDFTPTYVNANSFTVTGDQTGILTSGRRLKLYDASGTAQPIYRSIGSASFTVVTTVSLDSGVAITSSLTSFATAILSPIRSSPRVPYLRVTGALEAASISATTATILWQTVLLDNSGWYTSADGRYTPQLAGLYGISGLFVTSAASAASYIQLTVRKNFSDTADAAVNVTREGGGVIAVNGAARLNGSSDYLQCGGFTAGGWFRLASGGYLTIYYLGPV